jgi:hypothetical protein
MSWRDKSRWLGLLLITLCCCGSPPAASVLEAVELSPLQNPPHVVGRDGASTAHVWGQDVWIFGDTFLDTANADGFNFVSNTYDTSAFAVVDGGIHLLEPLDNAGAPAELLWPTGEELAYDIAHQQLSDGGCEESPCGGRFATWPGAIAFDPSDGGSALVFYALVSAAPGDFNFSVIGEGVAMWTDPAQPPARPTLNVCDGGPPTALFCADEPNWGEGAALVDGGVYTFACAQNGLDYPCQLARVPFAQAFDRSAWQFWSGTEWSAQGSTAATLFNGGPILSFFFNAYVGQWMAVYSKPLSNQVAYRTAPALTGPWSDEGTLFIADMGDAGGTAYDAYVHPELGEQNGKVQYVTYSRSNGTPFGDEFALWRVTLQ